MTMFTSLPPGVHGVAGKLTPLQVPVVTLAEVLRDRGYATAAFTENGPLAHGRGFERGFDAYTENRSPIYIRPPGQIDRTFSQARSWLERHDSQFRSTAPTSRRRGIESFSTLTIRLRPLAIGVREACIN